MKKVDISENWLRNKYINEEMSVRQIAQYLDCPYHIVHKKFHEYNISKLSACERTKLRGKKICTKCKASRSLSEFSKSAERPDGFNRHCRGCASEIGKNHRERYRRENADPSTERAIERHCYGCKITKNISEFNKCIGKVHGVDTYCKKCSTKISKKKYEKVMAKNSNKVPTGERMCSKCRKVKKVDEFYTGRGRAKLTNSQCKLCESKYKSEFYENNRDVILNRNRRWRDKNQLAVANADKKRRDLETALDDYSVKDQETTKDIFQNKCFKCYGESHLQIDHHYPLSAGHGLSIKNAVLLCRSCNCSKHAKLPKKFYSLEELEELNGLLEEAELKQLEYKDE